MTQPKKPVSEFTRIAWTLGILGVLAFAFLFNSKEDEKKPDVQKQAKLDFAELPESTPQDDRDELELQVSRLRAEFFTSASTNIESVVTKIESLEGIAKTIKEGLADKDSETVEFAKQMEKEVISFQTKHFPKYREVFAKIAAERVWEENVYVKVSGQKKDVITFTGGMFAANKNIKAVQTELSDRLNLLRFKQVRYKWYDGDEEYTYYDIKSKKDSEL
jgi:hypothetical protein